MTNGKWMEVAREFAGNKYISVDLLARAMAMVAEVARERCLGIDDGHGVGLGAWQVCLMAAQANDAEIIARLRARLKEGK